MDFLNETYLNDKEYMALVIDILENEDFQKLDKITHHHYTTRLRHSLYVSYISYKVAKSFNLNTKAVARAGLLHDYFHENREEIAKMGRGSHGHVHPYLALENAKKIVDISELEEDIILKHMFLCTKCSFPKYRESMVVTSIDKYCAIVEVSRPIRSNIQTSVSNLLRKLNFVND